MVSADEDENVVAKTDVRDDGKVHRYTYTEPDDISKGHGHAVYDSLEDFYDDNPSWERDKDDEKSLDRDWNGNGYNLTLEELKELKRKLLENQYNNSAKLLLRK